MTESDGERRETTGAIDLVSDASGRGPTSVLLHGFGEGRFVWQAVRDGLGRTLALDLRGHGDSPWDRNGDYGVAAHAADVRRALGALDGRPFVLIGHSLGGEIALRVAVDRPANLRGVVLVDCASEPTAASVQIAAEFREASAGFASEAAYVDWLADHRPMTRYDVLAALAPAALRRDGRGVALKRDPHLLAHRLAASCPGSLRADLGRVDVPVLIVSGAASSFLPPAAARALVGLCARGALATVTRAGHAVMLDNPELFVAAVRPFLDAQLADG